MKRLILVQFFAFLFLITASVTAQAEYYYVYQGPNYFNGYPPIYPDYLYTGPIYEQSYYGNQGACCQARPVCHRPRVVHRRVSCCRMPCRSVYYEEPVAMHYFVPRRGYEQVSEYAWVPYP